MFQYTSFTSPHFITDLESFLFSFVLLFLFERVVPILANEDDSNGIETLNVFSMLKQSSRKFFCSVVDLKPLIAHK